MNARVRFLLAAGFTVLALRLMQPLLQQAPTFDEGLKMAASYAFVTERYPYYDFENPPLYKLVYGLPLLALHASLPAPDERQRISGTQHYIHPFSAGYRFLFRNRVPAKTLLVTTRSLSFLFYLAAGLLLFFFLCSKAPPAAAVLGGLLYFTCPNLAAAAVVGNNDTLAVLSIILFLWAVVAFIERPSLKNTFLSAAALALAVVSKYSLLALIPFYAALLAVLVQRRALPEKEAWRAATIATGIVLLALEASYLFLPPKTVFTVLKAVFSEVSAGKMAYVMGRYSSTGFVYFHPLAFLLKTPLPVTLLIAYAAFVFVREKKQQDLRLLAVSGALLLFAAEAFFSKFNLGFRYFLPFYPIAYVFVPLALADRVSQVKRSLPAVAVLLGLSVLLTHPRYQSYFNCLIGKNGNAYHYFVDSTLDWGQDLGELAAYLKKEGDPELILSYFGTCDPGYYGLTFQNLASDGLDEAEADGLYAHLNSDAPKKEYLAVSATCLAGLDYPDHTWFAFLKDCTPVKRIGHTIFVYDVTDKPEMYKGMARIYAANNLLPHLLRSGRRVYALAPDDGFGRLCDGVSRMQAAAAAKARVALFELEPSLFGNTGDRPLLEKTALAYVTFLAKMKQYPAALRQLDALEVLQWEDLAPKIDDLRGVIYLRAGALDAAEASLQKSIGARSGNAAAWFYLGLISERRNELTEAADMYRQALAYAPGFRPAKVRLERILRLTGGSPVDSEGRNDIQ